MSNTHATDCRQLADRIEIGAETGNLDTSEAIGELRHLALTYAAKCDGLEAVIRSTREGLELVA